MKVRCKRWKIARPEIPIFLLSYLLKRRRRWEILFWEACCEALCCAPCVRLDCSPAMNSAFLFSISFVRLAAEMRDVAAPLHLYHYRCNEILPEPALCLEQHKTHREQGKLASGIFVYATDAKCQIRKTTVLRPQLPWLHKNFPLPLAPQGAQFNGGLCSFPEGYQEAILYLFTSRLHPNQEFSCKDLATLLWWLIMTILSPNWPETKWQMSLKLMSIFCC